MEESPENPVPDALNPENPVDLRVLAMAVDELLLDLRVIFPYNFFLCCNSFRIDDKLDIFVVTSKKSFLRFSFFILISFIFLI